MGIGFGGGGAEWLIAGLGNPGAKYRDTRHNMGFLAVELLAQQAGESLKRLKFKSLYNVFPFAGRRCLVMKPQTFMNLSGEAIQAAAQFYKIPPEKILVIYDDIALPVGKIRVRPKGSDGGHNGIKNIIAHLGTQTFPRIRIGVGAPAGGGAEMLDWVIGNPSQQERQALAESFRRAVLAAACIVEEGCEAAMNRYN